MVEEELEAAEDFAGGQMAALLVEAVGAWVAVRVMVGA